MTLLDSPTSMRADAGAEPIRQGRSSPAQRDRAALVRKAAKIALAAVPVFLLAVLAVGVGFAGSADRVAGGVTVGGLDVAGLNADEAERALSQRAQELAAVPVPFQAGGRAWPIAPAQLALRGDWERAVGEALDEGAAPIPLRGLQRLQLRIFGTDVQPAAGYEQKTLETRLRGIAREVKVKGRQAAIVLRDGEPVVVPGEAGRELDIEAAERTIVQALTRFERAPVALPVVVEPPTVTRDALEPVAEQVRIALSAPVTFEYKGVHWSVAPAQIATFLRLPQDGERRLEIGGPAAEKYFAGLARAVAKPPREVGFTITSAGTADMVPSKDGRKLDGKATADAFLRAGLSTTNREAKLAVVVDRPHLSTERAKALGIKGLVGSYTTYYGGDPNRIHNVRLVSDLIDRHTIAPGATFSFNKTTGERNAEKGFLEAPVIINGELQNGLGGGVCQVSTTVFNAAYEAGLPISERHNHALYIDHYPLGRDATVNYPDLDLKFVNDTGSWLLVETVIGPSSLTVRLFGTPVNRRVETTSTPLRKVAPPTVERILDPKLYVGEQVIQEAGMPSRAVSVRRIVYDRRGKLLYDTTWSSTYVSEPRAVRVGTKTQPTPTTTQATTTRAESTTTTNTGTSTGKD
jgi:vancomycin resistance protein YoaR